MEVVSSWLDRKDELDEKLYQHMKYVISRSLFEIKSKGLNDKSYEAVGKLLFRFYNVLSIYKKQKKGIGLANILNLIEEYVKMFVSEYAKG